jgi:hypothetical protein
LSTSARGRPQRVGLEHHADVALPWRHVEHILAADDDRTVLGLVEARDEAQQRRLPATGRTEEGEELAGLDIEVDVLQHMQRTVVEVHVADADRLGGAVRKGRLVDIDSHSPFLPDHLPMPSAFWRRSMT